MRRRCRELSLTRADTMEAVETLRVWKGEITDLPVGPAEDVYLTIPRRQYSKLSARIEKNTDISAPVARGSAVGSIIVNLDDKEVLRAPLVALQDVAEGGFWGGLVDSALLWFE